MNEWKVTKVGKTPKLVNPILIEGLPGIGNVGKVAVDFIIDELEAKKVFELFSYAMPHSVFVNEANLVELPSIAVYHKKVRKQDLLFVAGDAQPIDERSTYDFSDAILKLFVSLNGKQAVTLGGIGLPSIPKKPKVYCTGTSKPFVAKFCSNTQAQTKIYGIVGPIIGVSGLLLGLAPRHNVDAVSFLAETYGHPMYLGIRGAREIVSLLNEKLALGIDMKSLDAEISHLESEAEKTTKSIDIKKSSRGMKAGEATYIG